MNHRQWIMLFMGVIPALLLLVVALYIYWRDQQRRSKRGRTRVIRQGRRRR